MRASMRPRRIAAGDQGKLDRTLDLLPRFNEAAAECRGRFDDVDGGVVEDDASMRPRRSAAGDIERFRAWINGIGGFNEAAAECRGRSRPSSFAARRWDMLQ